MLRDLLAITADVDEKESPRGSQNIHTYFQNRFKGNNATPANGVKKSSSSFLHMLKNRSLLISSEKECKVMEKIKSQYIKHKGEIVPIDNRNKELMNTLDHKGLFPPEQYENGFEITASSIDIRNDIMGSGLPKHSGRYLISSTVQRPGVVSKDVDDVPSPEEKETFGFYSNGEVTWLNPSSVMTKGDDAESYDLLDNQNPHGLRQSLEVLLQANGYKGQSVDEIAASFEDAIDKLIAHLKGDKGDRIRISTATPADGKSLIPSIFVTDEEIILKDDGYAVVYSQATDRGSDMGGLASHENATEYISSKLNNFSAVSRILSDLPRSGGFKVQEVIGILSDMLKNKGFDEQEVLSILSEVKRLSVPAVALGDITISEGERDKLSSLVAETNSNIGERDKHNLAVRETAGVLERQLPGQVINGHERSASDITSYRGVFSDKDHADLMESNNKVVSKVILSDVSIDEADSYRDDHDGLLYKNHGKESLLFNNRESLAKPFPVDMALRKIFSREDQEGADNKDIHKSNAVSDILGTLDAPKLGAGDKLQKMEGNSQIEVEPLIQQIADKLPTAFNRGTGRVLINLSPPHLGGIDIDIMVRESRVQVFLTVSNRDVQQILQLHVDRLREALQQQGMQVESFDVLYNGNYSNNDGHFAGGGILWQDNGKKHYKRNEPAINNSLPAPYPLSYGPQREALREGISVVV